MTRKENEALLEGFRARLSGVELSQCPHQHYGMLRYFWLEGWLRAADERERLG